MGVCTKKSFLLASDRTDFSLSRSPSATTRQLADLDSLVFADPPVDWNPVCLDILDSVSCGECYNLCHSDTLVESQSVESFIDPLNWWCYFLSRRWYVAWCAKINHLVLTLPRWLLHMLHWWSRIILYLIHSNTLSLLRWTLNYLDIIITSWCCFLMAGTGLISSLSRRMWTVVINQPNLINWKPMKHLFHGVVECVQENFIMIRHGIMNRLFTASMKKRLSSASSASVCPCNRTLGSGISEQLYCYVF